MPVIRIRSHIHDYKVAFGKLNSFLHEITENKYAPSCYLIDKNVWTLYRNKYFNHLDRSRVITIESNEFNKNLKSVQGLYDKLIKLHAKRNAVLVSCGGGITQDVSGFFASTLYRGIRWIFIPTTLLAQADSCIGSKTSLNYKDFKNLIGTFYPPHGIFIDVDFIDTQDTADFYSGLGEIIKLHIMGGKHYLREIINELPLILHRKKSRLLKAIRNCLLIKKGYIEKDEFDAGVRNLLNYGHCFGHALETASDFKISHGQAVIFGMILANIVSRKRSLLSCTLESKIFEELLLPIAVCNPKPYLKKKEKMLLAMKKDKKRTGKKLPLIIMRNGYRMDKLLDVEEREIKFALADLLARIKSYEIF